MECISITRDRDWIKLAIDSTMKLYRAAINMWRLGTGDGPGAPENDEDWDRIDTEIFQNNDKVKGHYLSCIYMHDMGFSCLFDAENKDILEEDQLEDG